MSETIKLKKGFDINLAGKAEKKIAEIDQPETFALKPTDFLGMSRPKLKVQEGDNVNAGTPLLFDKVHPEVLYTAPVSGEIVEIKRGEKRKLLEIKILADKEVSYEEFKKHSVSDINSLSREDAQAQMMSSGVWPHIIQRPYGVVADPADTPKAIFISAFDSNPLAADISFLLEGQEQNFQTGVEILKKFSGGAVHINVNAKAEVSPVFSLNGVNVNKFSGPHPAGNVGVQIHHLDPINKGEIVWTVNPVGVVQIGKLFLEGKYDASKIISVVGSEIQNPQYYKTYSGACINKFIANNLKQDHVRFISGNILTGEKVTNDGYLGFYHNQFTVIPEGDFEEPFGWIAPSTKKLSFHKGFGLLSFLNPKREFVLDTNTHGESRAFVQTGEFERVLPMDILPTYLFKAIMAEDYDDMEALGLYEVIEEDVALCEFIDMSKHDLQSLVREGLDLLKNS